MRRQWSFYNAETGEFHSRRYSAPNAKDLERNTPKGCVAIEGAFDRLSKRFDIESGEVIDWVNSAEIDAIASRERVSHAKRRIAELETSQLRAMREHSLSPNERDAEDKTPRERLQAIDEEIVSLRDVISGKDTNAP